MLIDGCPGNLIGDEYSQKLDDFKKEFGRAKESFDRSMQVEVLKAIHGIGAFLSRRRKVALTCAVPLYRVAIAACVPREGIGCEG